MIHILLLVLKIIGIILLAVLALILLILFFPIRYKGKAEFEGVAVKGSLKGHWLCHILSFNWEFIGSDSKYTVRLFGFPLSSSNKKQKSNKTKETNKTKEIVRINRSKEKDAEGFSEPHEPKNNESVSDKPKQNSEFKNGDRTSNNRKEDIDNKGIKEKVKEAAEKIKTLSKKIVNNTKEACDKIKEIKDFITANTTKEAYNYGKKLVIKFIKHIFPKKIKANINMGFEEPHITGEVLGFIAMGYATVGINPNKIVINPDFQNKVFNGWVKYKGHITIGVVGYYFLKFYYKKEINDIIKKFS